MEQNFDTILTSLLESYDNSPNKDISTIINEKCNEMGLSEEGQALLKETNETIDAFTEKATSLAKAREEGETRKHWILNEMDKITEGRSEDEKAMVASAISSINERTIQESLTEE
ncbi:MAG: hypothetical protein IKB70_14045 [Bacilli bacterium]|nr:hypothetical protein [Bacilli bacterium]